LYSLASYLLAIFVFRGDIIQGDNRVA
jgi:hypothetical protein